MAYLQKAFTPGDPTITFHLEKGEELPKPGDIIEIGSDRGRIGEQFNRHTQDAWS